MFDSKNYTVMIISTGNIPEIRKAIRDSIYHWNEINSLNLGITYIASGYDLNMRSDSGDRPQSLINNQIVEKSDFAIAVFGDKIGKATGGFLSGSAEEIELHLKAKKKVFVYFSNLKISIDDIDAEQVQKLKNYKKQIGEKSVNYKEFNTVEELKGKINDDLTLYAQTLEKAKANSSEKDESEITSKVVQNEIKKEVNIDYDLQRVFQYGGVPEINKAFDVTIPNFRTRLKDSTKEVIINYIASKLQMSHRDFYDIVTPMKLLNTYFDFIQSNQLKVFDIVLDEYIDFIKDSTYSYGAIQYTKQIFDKLTKDQYKGLRDIYIYKMLHNFTQLYKTNAIISKFMNFTEVEEDNNLIEKEVRIIINKQIEYSKKFPLGEDDIKDFDELNKKLDEIQNQLKPKSFFDY